MRAFLRHRRVRTTLAIAALMVICLLGYNGAQTAGDALADELHVVVIDADHGDALLYDESFGRDETETVTRVHEAIAALPRDYSPLRSYTCTAVRYRHIVYTFTFLWHGIVTQQAKLTSGCGPGWSVSSFGVPRVGIGWPGPTDIWQHIASATGVSIIDDMVGPNPIPTPAPTVDPSRRPQSGQ